MSDIAPQPQPQPQPQPEPAGPRARQQRADGQRTRNAILREAVSQATIDGLEGLSIGNLATALDMSKSGLYAHFGSKQELQLATIDEADRIFRDEVIDPALAVEPGIGQLATLCNSFFDHLERRTLPGGCFFVGAALEMGTHPGPVKERVITFHRSFAGLIRQFAAAAVEQDQLPAGQDLDELVFELSGIILAANASFVLYGNPNVLGLAREVVRRRLGIEQPTP